MYGSSKPFPRRTGLLTKDGLDELPTRSGYGSKDEADKQPVRNGYGTKDALDDQRSAPRPYGSVRL